MKQDYFFTLESNHPSSVNGNFFQVAATPSGMTLVLEDAMKFSSYEEAVAYAKEHKLLSWHLQRWPCT